MKKEKIKNIGFQIHPFMTERLMLGGGELLVFSVIYSFTRGEEGLFFGSLEFIAINCGISVSTVKRALSSLGNMGYIEKCKIGERTGYRTTVSELCSETDTDSTAPENGAESLLPSPHAMMERGFFAPELLAESVSDHKYEFHTVGRSGIVRMTAEQYKRLLALVGSETLASYVRRLEMLIEKKGYKTFNPYKTIKKWIYSDAGV